MPQAAIVRSGGRCCAGEHRPSDGEKDPPDPFLIDGVLHDFTRKRGLVWSQTFLPENAPPEWADHAVLWNAVEEAAIQTLNAQESRCEQELNHALEEYEALSTHASNFDSNTLWQERLKEREALTNEARATLQTRFGADYSEKRLNFAEQELREMLPQKERALRQYWKETYAWAAKNRNQAKESAR